MPKYLTKGKIVPRSRRDAGKEDVCGDAVSRNYGWMRFPLSLKVEKGFSRMIMFDPPPEENDNKGLWKLLLPAYGFTEFGRLWFIASHKAVTMKFPIDWSKYDNSS